MTPREPYYAPGRDFSRVTLNQVAVEIGRSPHKTAKLLAKLGFIGFDPAKVKSGALTYDARSIEVLKAFLGQPHRKYDESQNDWLGDYIGGSHHG